MITHDKMKNCIPTYSIERLNTFVTSDSDTMEDIAVHYSNNIIISQALYPELCTLEVILRNAINNTLKMQISDTWLEDEIKNNTLLEPNDYQLLLNAYNSTQDECKNTSKPFTTGRVIANLNFGFWTNLCVKKYNSKIWNKGSCFKGIFVNYPSKKQAIAVISQKLYKIRKLRNRIFHYEPIFKNPEKTLELYNIILEILSYLPNDHLKILSRTSNFLNTYNKLLMQKI